MKITSRLKMALKSLLSLQLSEVATDKATLIWDGDMDLAEGLEVFVKDENEEVVVAPDGDYTTEDGKVITVAEGKVAGIKDPEAEVAPEAEPEANVEQAEEVTPEAEPVDEPEDEGPKDEDRIAALEGKVADILAGIEQVLNTVAALEGRMEEVENKVAKAETTPAEEPIVETPEEDMGHKSKMSYLRK